MNRITTLFAALTIGASAMHAQEPVQNEYVAKAVENLSNAVTVMESTWDKGKGGSSRSQWVADTYNLETGKKSGASDVWPYTAAIEGCNAILEALTELKDVQPEVYEAGFTGKIEHYTTMLTRLIDCLAYYRGTYTLASYTGSREWSPYAVPRASVRNKANVTGILNVYDDQMWICRELVRAYRLTDNTEYRDLAAYLADYVIDGWDCWHDADGKEYGGITWGPGYNSKHACSNGPIIQPLVWLSDIYKNTGEKATYSTRDAANNIVSSERERSEVYAEMAAKVYAWQQEHLADESGVFWDMMGADNKILTEDGVRQHVDTGNRTGNFYSYNTGTMISGAAELYRITGEQSYLADMGRMVDGAFKQFHHLMRTHRHYQMNTDATATQGFNTWFNNVLFRSYMDASAYIGSNTNLQNAIDGQQYCLDYAMEHYLRQDLLPIKLLQGWGSDKVTKPFHQFSFVSEMSLLALKNLRDADLEGISGVAADGEPTDMNLMEVYTLSGVRLGLYGEVVSRLAPGIYICGGHKLAIR